MKVLLLALVLAVACGASIRGPKAPKTVASAASAVEPNGDGPNPGDSLDLEEVGGAGDADAKSDANAPAATTEADEPLFAEDGAAPREFSTPGATATADAAESQGLNIMMGVTGSTGASGGEKLTQEGPGLEGLGYRQECLVFQVSKAGSDEANGLYWKTEKSSRSRPYATYAKPYAKEGADEKAGGKSSTGTAAEKVAAADKAAAGQTSTTFSYMSIFRCVEGDAVWRIGDAELTGCGPANTNGELYKLRAEAGADAESPMLDGVGDRGVWSNVKGASPAPQIVCVQRTVAGVDLREVKADIGKYDSAAAVMTAHRAEAEAHFSKDLAAARDSVEVDVNRKVEGAVDAEVHRQLVALEQREKTEIDALRKSVQDQVRGVCWTNCSHTSAPRSHVLARVLRGFQCPAPMCLGPTHAPWPCSNA
jgi:hypothetical protein